jgi:hypothetical protein
MMERINIALPPPAWRAIETAAANHRNPTSYYAGEILATIAEAGVGAGRARAEIESAYRDAGLPAMSDWATRRVGIAGDLIALLEVLTADMADSRPFALGALIWGWMLDHDTMPDGIAAIDIENNAVDWVGYKARKAARKECGDV